MRGKRLASFHGKWMIIFLHLLIMPVLAQRIQLTWDPSSTPNISYYGIYRSTHPDSTFTLMTTVNSPVRIYVDGTIQSNVHYFWAVTAIDATGRESGFSNLVDTTIVKSNVAPTILTHPQNVAARVGETAQFRVVASGTLPLTYQWQKNDANIPEANSASYTTPVLTLGDQGARFRCVVTNAHGSATSAVATLTVVSGTRGRVITGQIVLYTFEENGGAEIRDVSGFGTPLNLIVSNQAAVKWIPGALAVNSSTMITSAGAATKVIAACKASNAITIEAWVKPSTATQNGPARIVSLSADAFNRNFTLGHGLSDTDPPALYSLRLRTTTTTANGTPSLNSPNGSLNTQLSHVVYTRDAAGAAKIYVNNAQRASGAIGGDLSNWSESFNLALANELTGDRPWLGEYHLVAIYNRALNTAEVGQNYEAGPNLLPVSVESTSLPPIDFQLDQNYPNPFNPSTAISYSLPQRSHVDLTIYDLNSRKVYKLVEGFQEAGRYTVTWQGIDSNGTPVPSGMYYYRIRALNTSKFRKMILAK